MMRRTWVWLAGSAALLTAPGAALAHHAATAAYQVDKTVTVKGVLTRVDWVNPHILIRLTATDATGKATDWLFESNPPAWWRAAGLTKKDWDVRVGQTVTVTGNPARVGKPAGYFRQVVFQDGTSLRFAKTLEGPE